MNYFIFYHLPTDLQRLAQLSIIQQPYLVCVPQERFYQHRAAACDWSVATAGKGRSVQIIGQKLQHMQNKNNDSIDSIHTTMSSFI